MIASLVSPPDHGKRPPGAGPSGPGSSDMGFLGMLILLASLSMLFGALLVGFVVLRLTSQQWNQFGRMPLPPGLLLSTIVLIGASVTIEFALRRVRDNDASGLRRWLVATSVLGGSFVLLQVVNWFWAVERVFPTLEHVFPALFFLLSGVHAAHVLGGLVPMLIVTRNAFRGRYHPLYYPGVRYCAMYWHFLDVTWLLIVLALLLR